MPKQCLLQVSVCLLSSVCPGIPGSPFQRPTIYSHVADNTCRLAHSKATSVRIMTSVLISPSFDLFIFSLCICSNAFALSLLVVPLGLINRINPFVLTLPDRNTLIKLERKLPVLKPFYYEREIILPKHKLKSNLNSGSYPLRP